MSATPMSAAERIAAPGRSSRPALPSTRSWWWRTIAVEVGHSQRPLRPVRRAEVRVQLDLDELRAVRAPGFRGLIRRDDDLVTYGRYSPSLRATSFGRYGSSQGCGGCAAGGRPWSATRTCSPPRDASRAAAGDRLAPRVQLGPRQRLTAGGERRPDACRRAPNCAATSGSRPAATGATTSAATTSRRWPHTQRMITELGYTVRAPA